MLTTLQEAPWRLVGSYERFTGKGAALEAALNTLKLFDIPKASRHHHLIPGVRDKSVVNRHMMDVVLSALGVSGVNADKLTFGDAMLTVIDAPDPALLWFGTQGPPAAPPPAPSTPPAPPPNTVGSTSSDADDD
jgi:hypothetical protein